MDRTQRAEAALMGALVADAACLGVHWIYDVGRIARIRADHGGSAAFVPVDGAHYAGKAGYFAHAGRQTGQQTQYGEVLRLAMRSIRAKDGFDVAAYQSAFAALFGAGGAYRGYIDRPTRGALDNIAAGRCDPSGIDDDQLPALATLPAVILGHRGAEDPADLVNRAMSVTNLNTVAAAHGRVFLSALTAVVDGTDLRTALADAGAEDPALVAALSAQEPDSVAYGEVTGRACHLPMAMPLAFHIMARADSFRDAVERNIDAGGDSAGRAIIIGALMGAARGVAGKDGVPLDWMLRLEDAAAQWDLCRALVA